MCVEDTQSTKMSFPSLSKPNQFCLRLHGPMECVKSNTFFSPLLWECLPKEQSHCQPLLDSPGKHTHISECKGPISHLIMPSVRFIAELLPLRYYRHPKCNFPSTFFKHRVFNWQNSLLRQLNFCVVPLILSSWLERPQWMLPLLSMSPVRFPRCPFYCL